MAPKVAAFLFASILPVAGLPALRKLEGLKGGSTGAPRGDLYVVLQVVLPEDSPEARIAAAALQKLYKSDVRKDVVL